MQRRDNSLDRVVEQGRAYPNLLPEFERVSVIEEGLVLLDGLALVVENGPAAADPPRIYDWSIGSVQTKRPRLGLNFFLNLSAETV